MSTIHIFNATVILNDRILRRSSVTIKSSKILAVGKSAPKGAGLINAKGLCLAPGFIDTHIHGNPDDIAAYEMKHGTTSFVVAVSCGCKIPDISGYSNVLGVRLEGPYINPKMAGTQDERFIKPPSTTDLRRVISSCGADFKMVTLAPELPGAKKLIKACRQNGVMPSIGHSDASYKNAKESFGLGIRHATHLFNAMSGPKHGTAGAALAALFDKRVTIEIIADLKHVRPELLRLVFAVKDKRDIILVTDSVRAPASGHKIGSRITMMDAVKNTVKCCGVSLSDAVRMASENPARLFGLSDRKGSISPGKDADIVAFDKDFNVKFTMIGGRIVYQKKGMCKRCAG